MSATRTAPYEFDDPVPLSGIAPGSTVLVAGPGRTAARELALHLALAGAGRGEGMVMASTAARGDRFRQQCEQLHPDVDGGALRIVDATGQNSRTADWGITTVGDASELSRLGMAISSSIEDFRDDGTPHVRAGVYSVTGLLTLRKFKSVYKFLNILAGRVRSYDGLGVLYLETSTLSDGVADTLSEVCEGRIDVEERSRGDALRVSGLDGQPEGWTPFEIGTQWPRGIGGHAMARQVRMGRGASTRYHCIRCGVQCRGSLDIRKLRGADCR